MSIHDLGVNVVSDTLRTTLRQYIEAQYHIRNENLIEERRGLLREPETIYQEPYIEATPVYEIGASLDELDIPSPARAVLSKLATLNVGIYSRLYVHQAQALEAFLAGKDVMIATGTGSGKTESFLMPIIGSLALEAEQRPESAALPGCRALLLYPMNALVNDQLSRIRNIFGSLEAARTIAGTRHRTVRFATYTGRTPYPGKRTAGKDTRQVKPLFEDFYLKLLHESPDIVAKLADKGRWPSKDLEAFYRADLVEDVLVKTGKRQGEMRKSYHWSERLRTGQSDRELMMRHEVQLDCPDLLITNYSMLEYMLMRPIERSIFTQTKAWLDQDSRNEFILVVDEAHMYYGAAGAEVALLIRRLMSRLGLPRERMRCILTSASLGGVEEDALIFARDLTGLRANSSRTFVAIKGTLEKRHGFGQGDEELADALAQLSIRALEGFPVNLVAAVHELNLLCLRLG